jgi:hypothetical protein
MPLYEYECESDGTVIELLRSARDADRPVPDPDGKGRVFRRRLSTFAHGAPSPASGGASRPLPLGGACPCGKPHGSCRA